MTPDKTELHNKFIEKFSQGIIFYKQPFLPSEVKYIFDSIDIRETLRTKINEEQQIQLKIRNELNQLDTITKDFPTLEYNLLEDKMNNSVSREQEFKSILENPIR